MLDVKITANS